jgi:hypothetical protein
LGNAPASLLARAQAANLRNNARERGLCERCGRTLSPHGSCSRRLCNFGLWAGDSSAYARENARQLDPVGKLDMLTATAPGADVLPFDPSFCRHPPGVRCSGPLGCRVYPAVARQWNDRAPALLSKWWDAANRRVERRGLRAGRGRPPWFAFPELQDRGVLHWHFVFAAGDRPYVVALAEELRATARAHGFGVQVDFKACLEEGRSKAMGYVVKAAEYVAKAAGGGDERAQVTGLLRGPLRGRPFMRASPKLTGASRVTMRNLRHRRTLYARGLVTVKLPCSTVETVIALENDREVASRSERYFLAHLASVFGDRPPPPWRRPRRWPLPPPSGRHWTQPG